ncbi:unnamed protein product [Camellia sinensis]
MVCVGSFGSVYKGALGEGKNVVAVKVLNLQCLGASKNFLTECETLRHMKHRYLLKVLTACSSVDYHGNDFKALVCEFMANEPIVHCDLKPSNVLLDNEMTTHVGDFGLARFLQEATHDRSANQSSCVGIRGSVGYAAAGKYTSQLWHLFIGDVHGEETYKYMFCDSLGLHNFVKIALPEQAASIIADPRLFKQKDQSSANSHKIQECLISILKVGITCSEELPKDRMAINDVGTQLQVIRNTLVGIRGVYMEVEELKLKCNHEQRRLHFTSRVFSCKAKTDFIRLELISMMIFVQQIK